MIIQDAINKNTINCQSNTKNRYKKCIYSDCFIVTVILEDYS